MKKFNPFIFLVLVAIFAVVLRLADIAGIGTPKSIAQNSETQKVFVPIDGKKAADMKAVEKKAEDKKAEEKKAEDAVPPPPAFGERAWTPAEVDVLQSLAKRRDELDRRDQQIAQREALLKAAETEVDNKIVEMNKLKKQLEELLNQQQKVQDERVVSLVKIYEGMKAKEAARIFDTLDMDVLMAVVGKMSERKSSPIIAAMTPKRAQEVTLRLAEQHKLPEPVPAAAPTPAPAAAPAPAPVPVPAH